VKTDALFYELFTFDPQLLLELLRLPIKARYDFDSTTLKTTEKRIDGFFRPIEGEGPLIFLEIQGYNDPRVYWRLFREISTWYEQHDRDEPFIGVALFLDEKLMPPDPPVAFLPPCQLIRSALEPLLRASGGHGALMVLEPLLLSDDAEFQRRLPGWRRQLEQMELSAHRRQKLVELFEYAVTQRFPELSHKELEAMLHLTPFEETQVGKDMIAIGEKRGRFIGEIHLAQSLLGLPTSTPESLARLSLKQLGAEARRLRAELEARTQRNAANGRSS